MRKAQYYTVICITFFIVLMAIFGTMNHYNPFYDLSSYKYDKSTNTYSIDILVDRDPSTDLGVCNKSPFDRGNITHLIFSLVYKPFPKNFKAEQMFHPA